MIPLKRTPEGEYIISRDLAQQLCGVEQAAFSRWLRLTPPPPTCPGGLPAKQFGNWIRKHQTLLKGQRGAMVYLPDGVSLDEDSPKKKNLNDEKIRQASATADKIEMENEVTAGTLVRTEDVETGWADILSRVKTRMMRVPFAAAQVVVGDDDLISVQKKIKDFVTDALNELSA